MSPPGMVVPALPKRTSSQVVMRSQIGSSPAQPSPLRDSSTVSAIESVEAKLPLAVSSREHEPEGEH